MLAKSTTKDFIQISTAPLKLRRELQEIHFLTVLEVEHAILITGGGKEKVIDLLKQDGYAIKEINLVIENAKENNIIIENEENLLLIEERKQIIRKYCLLDIIANYGNPIPADRRAGFLIVPGYSITWGIPQADVIKIAPMLEKQWKKASDPFEDIQWLLEKGFVKRPAMKSQP